ncbi:MAG TPA: POTRA domain-containing protein [Cellvibrio sp.]|nr:POTRA domain-containing protein [Cellvibrio sp.]
MDNPIIKTGTPCSAVLAASLLLSATALAQGTPPDAGQVLRENEKRTFVPATSARPSLLVPDEKDPAANPGQALDVQAIRLEGMVNIPRDELMPLIADLQGKRITLGELREGAKKITLYYRERGYVVARAYIPAQEIKDGTILVQVLEGTLVSGRIDNHSRVRERVLQSVLDAQELNGKVIASSTTDRGLLLLADLPSVGKVAGKLRPGEKVGTSDLIVTVDAGKSKEGSISLDTYGNRYTGQNRLNGRIAFNSPAGLGERIDLMATVTDEDLIYGRASYDLPVTGNGLRLGAALSSSSYELGQEFANLDAQGTAKTSGVYAVYPIVRGLNSNIWLTGNFEHRNLEDEVKSVNSIVDKTADVGTIEIFGDVVDAYGGGGYSTWRISGVVGSISIDTPSAYVIDQNGPRVDGSYEKLILSVSRLQAITEKTSVSWVLSAQTASTNLDSSEKFLIGGIYAARSYPQGEGAGDEGWLSNLELRHQLHKSLQVAVFYDAGNVEYNHDPYIVGREDISLRSLGVSLTGGYEKFLGKLTVAWNAGTDDATTAPDKDPRVWGSIGYNF